MNPPPLHVVATGEVVARSDFEKLAVALLFAGGPGIALHLRDRRLDARSLHGLALRLGDTARSAGGWCVVNDRADIALTARAQALQLGAGALPVQAARRVLGSDVAVGASVHSPAEARSRANAGADYLIVGTVFPTPTHPGGPIGGTDLIEACARIGPPVIGIGGIDPGNTMEVLAAGAAGVAVVRAVWDHPSPVTATDELLSILAASASAG
jgi:thiamine-phosphate pyrophosphorylase